MFLIACVSIRAEEIRHSFLVAGPVTGIVGEDDELIWDSGKANARDGWVLVNGNTLICWTDEIREYDGQKNVIWIYKKDPRNQELGTTQRLENGNTLVTELGAMPRLLEVDSKSGEIKVEVKLQPETDNFHMQTRMARKIGNGNYLVPHLLAFAVKEYTPKGEIVNTFNTKRPEEFGVKEPETWPFTAIRLPNGNTHINLTHGNRVIEVDSTGKTIWMLDNNDFTGEGSDGDPLADPCGAQRLPNGNIVIASYGANEPNQIRMFEVTRDKKIVWLQRKYGAHHFQILTTNGKPIEGAPLK